MKKVENKLRVLHYPEIPCEPFFVEVTDEEQAYFISKVLADQHHFLYDQNIIPDYSNVVTVVMWDEDSDGEGNPGWVDYWNESECMDFDEFVGCYIENYSE